MITTKFTSNKYLDDNKINMIFFTFSSKVRKAFEITRKKRKHEVERIEFLNF